MPILASQLIVIIKLDRQRNFREFFAEREGIFFSFRTGIPGGPALNSSAGTSSRPVALRLAV